MQQRAGAAPRAPERAGPCGPPPPTPIVGDYAGFTRAKAFLTRSPAITAAQLVKLYKTATADGGTTCALAAGPITGLSGGCGAGSTTTIAAIMGLVMPTSGRVSVLGVDMTHSRHRVLHRMNFESPYVEMPMRLTIRQNLTVFGMLYGVDGIAARV